MHPDKPLGHDPDGAVTVADAQALHLAITGLGTRVEALTTRLRTMRLKLTVLGFITAVIVLAGCGVVALAVHVNHVSACQARQNDAFRDVATSSRASRDTQDDAQITLLNTTIDPTLTPDQRRAAVVKYRDQILTARSDRAKNPFPDGNCA